ncbi:hypothetical protein [Lacticaseibacillus camelliae]|nr:hypothetical protein [Lacticaseibacillus camelliae]
MANSPLTSKRDLSAPKQGDIITIDAEPPAGRNMVVMIQGGATLGDI